jgi:hypothetical protein
VPSAAYQLGYRPGDFHDFSDFYSHVRYRPAFEASELVELVARGAWCAHPFKDHAALPAIYAASLR